MAQSFSDTRQISLHNFSNKIISRVINDGLESLLPTLIFNNQSRFMKGRSITKNILLAQDIISGIRKGESQQM